MPTFVGSQSFDDFCSSLGGLAGGGCHAAAPELGERFDAHAFEPIHPETHLRVMRLGHLEALVLSVPPGYRLRRQDATLGEAVRRISAAAAGIVRMLTPGRQWGRIAVLRLEEGWTDPDVLARSLELDAVGVMKFAAVPGEPPADVLARIPAIAPVWPATDAASPTWLEGISGTAGPLSEVDLEFAPRPGITVFEGGNATGKTALLRSIQAAIRNMPSPVDAAFSAGVPSVRDGAFLVGRAPAEDAEPGVERRMRAVRRAIGYGCRDGSLRMPLAFEGSGVQAAERVGRALLESAEFRDEPGVWPGLVLDTPTGALDTVRACKVVELAVRLAQSRQVLVSARGADESGLWRMVARDRDVPCEVVDLRGGTAVLKGTAFRGLRP